ncbi:MAG: DUF2779 domain-containing protein [Gammaproteobacteria bacterium]|nr:DUF2779 domain-containing protein [Gammaproteobacteria bacterium]
MQFTKTDFIQFLNCPKSLWLLKRSPENYPFAEFSSFIQKLKYEGDEVEQYVKEFFENADDHTVDFQMTFKAEDGLFARADAVKRTNKGKTILYEVKSSTSIKTGGKHNHLKDVCFQKICAERSGRNIDHVFLVHLNKEYVRDGLVDPESLLIFVDVTDKVENIMAETVIEVDTALAFLSSEVNMDGCTCIEKSRGNHCDTFKLFNPDIPSPSIYSLPRLNAQKRRDLLTMGILGLDAIADDYPLSENQRLVVEASKQAKPQINVAAIREFITALTFPLYFFDYETFASAVPLFDGASPHKQIPVQYSLHILKQDGSLTHRKYLEREACMSIRLIEQMQTDIGPTGDIISWHASFEKTQNLTLAEAFPSKAAFLNSLNDRTVDLEDVFKTDYVDARFDGSTSIKKVLPVICPHLDYSDLEIQDGASSMEAWKRMIDAEPEEAERVARMLLSYCERDTYSMVEIYRFLSRIQP